MTFMRRFSEPRRIYLDHASITPIDAKVVEVLHQARRGGAREFIGNPSSLHAEGVAAKKLLEDARAKIAASVRGHADEIVFTGSGTEANNIAVMGAVAARVAAGLKWSDMHIVTSPLEHASVLECMEELARRGAKVEYVAATSTGLIDVQDLRKKVTSQTTLVSVQYVNNEIGTIQPIGEVAKVVRHARSAGDGTYPLLHVDACQAFLYLEVNMERMGADLVVLDGQKMRGPRGVGILYIRRGVECAPIVFGGGQERELRSGTENVAAAIGCAAAFEVGALRRTTESARLTQLRAFAITELTKTLQNSSAPVAQLIVHGNESEVSPHILNFELPSYDAEALMLRLDAEGIACSTKSSCLRDSDESYVLKAIGANSLSSLRLSFGLETTKRDILKFIQALLKVLPLSRLQ